MLDEQLIKKEIDCILETFKDSWPFLSGKNVNRKLNGDVYEIALRQSLKRMFPDNKYGYGVVYQDELNRSGEIDIIIYKGNPDFEIRDLVVVNPKLVKAVIQVKGYIPNPKTDLDTIVDNLNSAIKLNPNIKGYCFTITANAKKSFPELRAKFSAFGIRLFTIWDMPGDNGKILERDGGFEDFINTLAKDILS